jgi:hypothetical protein
VARGLLLALPDDVLDLLAHRVERDAERLERLGRDALTLVDEAEQDVLGADVVVVQHLGLFLGQHDDTTGSVSESLEHLNSSRRRLSLGASVYRTSVTSVSSGFAGVRRGRSGEQAA